MGIIQPVSFAAGFPAAFVIGALFRTWVVLNGIAAIH